MLKTSALAAIACVALLGAAACADKDEANENAAPAATEAAPVVVDTGAAAAPMATDTTAMPMTDTAAMPTTDTTRTDSTHP